MGWEDVGVGGCNKAPKGPSSMRLSPSHGLSEPYTMGVYVPIVVSYTVMIQTTDRRTVSLITQVSKRCMS